MIDIAEALASKFDEVHYMDFYRDLFPYGEFEKKGVYEDRKYNGIAVSISKGKNLTKRYTITDDLDAITEMVSMDDFCLMSPISYVGKNRKSANARFMYALAIDLDGIDNLDQWRFFMQQIEKGHEMLSFVWGIPKPTYLVASGTGVHIYYVFETPIPMFKNIVEQLEILKRRLTWQAWTQGASSLHDKVQYESLFQGFRVVGTITKTGGRCRAFKVGGKVTVEYLNGFVPEEYRIKSFAYKSDLRLAEARKKYPEWYQRRVIERRPKKTWTCKKDLYNWWIRKLSEGAEQGHRYWCIMTLATYAKKCGVSREELEKDAYGLIPLMNAKGDEFTEDDVLHALEAYTDSYITYPIDTIMVRTGIPIKKNKRNGRKQIQHLQLARGIRQLKGSMGEVISGGGRPDKKKIIEEWRIAHPEGAPKDCIVETGISKNTVYRWWKEIEMENLRKCTNKAEMLKLSDAERVEKAKKIMEEVARIVKDRGFSEEDAYDVFLTGKTRKEQLQEEVKRRVFAESEVNAELLDALAKNGVREINIVPDDEYIEQIGFGFSKWLKNQKKDENK